MPVKKDVVEVSDKVRGLEAPAPYHIMVRYLSGVDIPERNMFRSETVEKHIKIWTDQGYKIHTSQHIASTRDEESGVSAEGIYFLFEYVG
jgi:hypothetical protein